jgi:hypothetical protein
VPLPNINSRITVVIDGAVHEALLLELNVEQSSTRVAGNSFGLIGVVSGDTRAELRLLLGRELHGRQPVVPPEPHTPQTQPVRSAKTKWQLMREAL